MNFETEFSMVACFPPSNVPAQMHHGFVDVLNSSEINYMCFQRLYQLPLQSDSLVLHHVTPQMFPTRLLLATLPLLNLDPVWLYPLGTHSLSLLQLPAPFSLTLPVPAFKTRLNIHMCSEHVQCTCLHIGTHLDSFPMKPLLLSLFPYSYLLNPLLPLC